MAPGRNTKRTAASAPAEEPASKKLASTLKKQGVTQGSYKQIAEAISHPMAGDLPEECRKMLLAALPQSLCVASDLRQEFQTLAVTMIEEVVGKIAENMQKALDEENSKVASVEASKAEFDEKLQGADQTKKDAEVTVSERDQELQASSEAVVANKAELAQREEEQRAGDVAFVAAQADKDALETGYNGSFQKLKVGEWQDGQAKELYEALLPLMSKLTLDESLLTATKSVLVKKPDQRGAFDSTVLDELDRQFQAKIAQIDALLAAEKPASEVRSKAVSDAKTLLEAAETKQKECSCNLVAAKEAEKEAVAAVKAAKATVAEYKPEFKAATELRDEKKQELESFAETTMGGFKQLKDRLSAKKLKEIKSAEDAVRAAAEAEEAAQAAEAEALAAEAEVKAMDAEPTTISEEPVADQAMDVEPTTVSEEPVAVQAEA